MLSARPEVGRLWTVGGRGGRLLYGPKGPKPLVTAAGFDARSGAVITRERNGTVRRWGCDLCGGLDELVALGKSRLRATQRTLTADEQARYLG
jgi:hypothetical protein